MNYRVTDIVTGRTLFVGSLEAVADFAQLNAEDIEWAIEEDGACETDVCRIEVDES